MLLFLILFFVNLKPVTVITIQKHTPSVNQSRRITTAEVYSASDTPCYTNTKTNTKTNTNRCAHFERKILQLFPFLHLPTAKKAHAPAAAVAALAALAAAAVLEH